MKVVLIRHTAVDVPQGTCYGQTDVPLKETFETEAAQVASNLVKYGKCDHAFCSPLSRCVRLATYCGYPHAEHDSRLMELNMGQWEMRPYSEITGPEADRWYADYLHVPTPGGESFEMQCRRVAQFLEELKTKEYQQVVVFTHCGVLISAQVYTGIKAFDQIFSQLPPYGGDIMIEI